MTAVTTGGGAGCALMRLLRPDADPLFAVLDDWPLTLPDLLGDSGPTTGVGSGAVEDFVSALERLLRPDRQVVLLALRAFEHPAPAPKHIDRLGDLARRAPAA